MPYTKMVNGKSVRNYEKERAKYHSRPEQMDKNAERKRARRKLEKEGKVKPFDGQDVNHKKPLKRGGSNARSNLNVQKASVNRSVSKTSKNRMKGNG
jgi:5-methylcytosine-specific restriction endonuclease McrA